MKKIIIMGTGSGFRKGTVLGFAEKGSKMIAGVQIGSQKSTLLEEADKKSVESEAIVLGITATSKCQNLSVRFTTTGQYL